MSDPAHIVDHQPGWQPEHTLSVADAIKEAMDDPLPSITQTHTHPYPQHASRVETPRDLPAPEPHLPLRKSSAASRMQSRKGSIPKPIFTPAQTENVRVARGFNPSPVLPSPRINDVTASSEHAFAAREPRRPFKNAVGMLEGQHPILQYAEHPPRRAATVDSYDGQVRPPASAIVYSQSSATRLPMKKSKSLKHSKSVGNGIRNFRQRITGKGNNHADTNGALTPDSGSPFRRTKVPNWEARDSFRSAMTSHSSIGHASSVLTTQTTHTSLSSGSEYVKIRREDYDDDGTLTDVDMSVDDVLGMYENGFDSSARPSMEVRSIRSTDITAKDSMDNRSARSLQIERPSSLPKSGVSAPNGPKAAHRRSQSASVLMLGAPRSQPRSTSPSPSGIMSTTTPSELKPRTSVHIVTAKIPDPQPPASTAPAVDVPRDRYGFKKVSHHVTLEQYDEWDRDYTEHIERRRKKWYAWMRQYGLATDHALRFPSKSEKAKRYVRKGIPPEFRGAAWFWYGGGPRLLAKHPMLYQSLLARVEEGELTDNDREHIERDLHRTFPDNVRFKPDPTTLSDAQAGAGSGVGGSSPLRNGETVGGDVSSSPDSRKKKQNRTTAEPEVLIIQKLRRVLQAFAVHNPQIGYCQSLNFIAGLLLLFLEENEEKTFILLNIVTSLHLPGTHGVALEGANIDIAVLMSFIKDTLPAIWNKLDDKKDSHGIAAAAAVAGGISGLRLPTVSLATTAWFMSLFVGTLPIESVLRVWDCLFFEGSKALFRIALAIFKAGESQIQKVSDPMEIFQVVQTIPRSMLDCNALLEVCFRRRGGFVGISQGEIEIRRAQKRRQVKEGIDADEGVVRKLKSRLRSRTAGRTS